MEGRAEQPSIADAPSLESPTPPAEELSPLIALNVLTFALRGDLNNMPELARATARLRALDADQIGALARYTGLVDAYRSAVEEVLEKSDAAQAATRLAAAPHLAPETALASSRKLALLSHLPAALALLSRETHQDGRVRAFWNALPEPAKQRLERDLTARGIPAANRWRDGLTADALRKIGEAAPWGKATPAGKTASPGSARPVKAAPIQPAGLGELMGLARNYAQADEREAGRIEQLIQDAGAAVRLDGDARHDDLDEAHESLVPDGLIHLTISRPAAIEDVKTKLQQGSLLRLLRQGGVYRLTLDIGDGARLTLLPMRDGRARQDVFGIRRLDRDGEMEYQDLAQARAADGPWKIVSLIDELIQQRHGSAMLAGLGYKNLSALLEAFRNAGQLGNADSHIRAMLLAKNLIADLSARETNYLRLMRSGEAADAFKRETRSRLLSAYSRPEGEASTEQDAASAIRAIYLKILGALGILSEIEGFMPRSYDGASVVDGLAVPAAFAFAVWHVQQELGYSYGPAGWRRPK